MTSSCFSPISHNSTFNWTHGNSITSSLLEDFLPAWLPPLPLQRRAAPWKAPARSAPQCTLSGPPARLGWKHKCHFRFNVPPQKHFKFQIQKYISNFLHYFRLRFCTCKSVHAVTHQSAYAFEELGLHHLSSALEEINPVSCKGTRCECSNTTLNWATGSTQQIAQREGRINKNIFRTCPDKYSIPVWEADNTFQPQFSCRARKEKKRKSQKIFNIFLLKQALW